MRKGQKVAGVRKTVEASGRERMWRTMKMLKVFTANDIAISASLPDAPVKLAEALHYVNWLGRGGYLVLVAPHSNARTGRRRTWRFVRNTGPKPPMVLRTKALWDPNLHQATYVPAPRGVAA